MELITLPNPVREKCRYELDVIEERGNDLATLRGCRLHRTCTRGFVDNTIKRCQGCAQYVPVSGRMPPALQGISLPPPGQALESTERANIRVNSPRMGNLPFGGRNPRIGDPRAFEDVLQPRAESGPLVWAYGLTSVPIRRATTFPRSLSSLMSSGFDKPTLFIDGTDRPQSWGEEFNLPVVGRYPRIGAYGNWILALGELYIRNPFADRYAIFQDDIECVLNLRAYLDRVSFPQKGYLNLYTFVENERLSLGRKGFYKASTNPRGLGALGLVFDRAGVQILLTHNHMVKRVEDKIRGHKYIDGAVVETMNMQGYSEYVHSPSLLQHTGDVSTLRNPKHPTAPSYPGEEWDALSLLSPIGEKEENREASDRNGEAVQADRHAPVPA